MKDPERFADGHPSALARSLIHAASDERPPASLLARTLSSAGLAGAAAATVTTAQAATAGAASGGAGVGATAASTGVWLTALKSAGLATVAGALVSTAVLHRTPAPAESARPPVTRAAPPVASIAPRPGARLTPEPEPSSGSNGIAPPSPSRPAPREAERSSISLLREEAVLIDEAREALAGGDAAATLRTLERHRQRFSRPHFQPEALYLKMQALRLVGEDDAARRAAKRLLSISPNGPQAAAARALMQTE